MVPVDSLIPYARNARTHSEEQIAQIAASIREFGWTNPILTDGDKGVIAGHGRLAAARKLELTEVPVIELGHLSPEQKKAYILADNRIALNSGWDEELQVAAGDVGVVSDLVKLAPLICQVHAAHRLDGHPVFAGQGGQLGDESVEVVFDLRGGVDGCHLVLLVAMAL